ncbi:right-handed parallel beta-helix repeat-containing protein [Acinetobacter baumannii]|uniref:right-handed parallel beta-helix repeat-containing protein n=1 Tax=Acinetobacter baumannii TaxID=470 RepID=UPI0007A4C0AD|nr:right-handed parallel beta-helix repeat-containing protein [Acinetobacter baumannii]EHU1763533.1 right-handed parallel beta-helix repeat-containing protein [Acinetobacter baumannii]EHU1766347.1 right-handed parallel beta-helix repeat-containing protein [Acinetobacter baumannii]EHU2902731.1 right-handed parallel beta-helix repeat-containing protein [Acinetobacter baumannii]EHU2905330.1 right-handed parallel beta-helix repeat-containing protein [Acinetobacter baumannii]EHU3260412.1 right-hand
MAVPEQTPFIEYTANGTTTVYPLTFDCDKSEYLIVSLDGEEAPVGSWSLAGGSITFNTAPANGVLITIERNTPFRRTTEYQSSNNSFRPSPVNKDFDLIWWKLQELGVADWILGNRISALKNYVDRKDDELKAYLMEEIRKQGVALDQLDEYYNYLMQRLAQIAVDKGWDASFVVDVSGLTQQQINDSSIHSVGSVSAMLALPTQFQKRIVQVKATGAMYQYDAEQAAVDDGVYVRNGWVLIGYHDQLLAGTAGLKGDGTNEYTKLKALLDVAATLKRPVNLCGLTITTAPISTAGDLKLIGSGSIKLLSGSNATLLTSAHNLVIDGDIQLDPDLANNSGGTVGAETHCTIKHTGPDLILKGAKIKPSRSINVVTRATRKVLSQDTEIDGGMVAFYAIAPNASVSLIGGEYKNSTLYDNIQILNGGDVVVERVRAKDSSRSGIVIGNSTGKARIFGNYATGAKIDGANQGGWGIVASVNSQDSVIGMNVCLNNQRGPMTVDTYPDSGPSVDNRISVFGNILGGKYNDAYATTGLGLNNVKHGNVTGNIIFSANQGILAVDSDHTLVHGNTIMDTVDFAFQGYLSPNITFKSNTVDGCTASGQAVIRFIDSTGFRCSGNTYRNLTGAASILYRVSGNTKDWIISEDDCLKLTAGSGYVFQILGAGVTGGKIRRNNYKAAGVAGWQWYIMSDNLAQFSTHDNEIESTGTNYISSGANVTAGDDTVNGSRNVWAAAPTGFKSRIGQVAAIAGVLKFWNGSAWA